MVCKRIPILGKYPLKYLAAMILFSNNSENKYCDCVCVYAETDRPRQTGPVLKQKHAACKGTHAGFQPSNADSPLSAGPT